MKRRNNTTLPTTYHLPIHECHSSNTASWWHLAQRSEGTCWVSSLLHSTTYPHSHHNTAWGSELVLGMYITLQFPFLPFSFSPISFTRPSPSRSPPLFVSIVPLLLHACRRGNDYVKVRRCSSSSSILLHLKSLSLLHILYSLWSTIDTFHRRNNRCIPP